MIRDYKIEDTDALILLWKSASAIAHSFLSPAFIEQEAENMRNIYFPHADTLVVDIAEDGHGPIGFISIIGDEIGGLFIHPSHQGKGFGKALVDHVVANKGPLKVDVFQKNAIGRHFYERYGFVEIEQYEHEPSGEITLKLAMESP